MNINQADQIALENSSDTVANQEIKSKLLEISPAKKRVFNLDQTIYLDSGSLILLKDISSHVPIPMVNKNLQETLKNTAKNRNVIGFGNFSGDASVLGKLKNAENSMAVDLQPNNNLNHTNHHYPEKDLENSRMIGESPTKLEQTKQKEKELDVFKAKDSNEEDLKKYACILKLLDNVYFTFLMLFFVFWALFSDDFRHVALSNSVDTAFDVTSLFALVSFTIEITLTAIAKKDYRWSFFFWLDILSTATMIFDISWISSLLFNQSVTNTAQLARAGRASRIGTRAGRVVRIIRLIKVVNLIKFKDDKKNNVQKPEVNLPNNKLDKENLNKSSETRDVSSLIVIPNPDETQVNNSTPSPMKLGKEDRPRRKSRIVPTDSTFLQQRNSIQGRRRKSLTLKGSQEEKTDEEKEDEDEQLKESRVGKKMSERTTIRVVVIVLALLVGIPLFSISYYVQDDLSPQYMVLEIMNVFENNTSDNTVKNLTYWGIINQQSGAGFPIVYMNLSGMTYYSSISVNDLRSDEKDTGYTQASLSNNIYMIVVDMRYETKITAGLSIGRTLFVCLILILGALFFSKDVNDLALRPIERMIEKVNNIAKNPLSSKDQTTMKDKYNQDRNETIQIENAIIKIGALLALGFGDAGSEIIGANIAKGGDVDPMLPGKKKCAIFGFCDIRNFTDATEVLQEEVMVFVNSIADIVHRYVDKYTGAANKNIGDAFLLVWKFPESEVHEKSDGLLDLYDSLIVQNIADLSLISFLKVYARINKDPILLRYRDDPRLLKRLPNYQVKMGFGLHVGWAIEGAIGSEFKIDASYLSPNVNMASRLEAATKQYGVPLLFSGDLAIRMSSDTRAKCRMIDIVTVKGSKKPIEMWTVDTNIDELQIAKPRAGSKLERKEVQKEKKEIIKEVFIDSLEKASILMDSDKDLLNMVDPPLGPFYEIFKDGFDAYISGNWSLAKRKFEQCLDISPDDGPVTTLYSVLKDNDFMAPEDWKGYRELTDK